MTRQAKEDFMPSQSMSRSYNRKEVIAREGEAGVGWFVLLEGKVGVFKHDVEIATYDQRGMVLGELSGILNKPRTASLVALEPTKIVFIDSGLDQLIVEHPDITKKILVNLAERLAKTTDDLITAVQKDAHG
jgi:CRP-like cAMP-binding protein